MEVLGKLGVTSLLPQANPTPSRALTQCPHPGQHLVLAGLLPRTLATSPDSLGQWAPGCPPQLGPSALLGDAGPFPLPLVLPGHVWGLCPGEPSAPTRPPWPPGGGDRARRAAALPHIQPPSWWRVIRSSARKAVAIQAQTPRALRIRNDLRQRCLLSHFHRTRHDASHLYQAWP